MKKSSAVLCTFIIIAVVANVMLPLKNVYNAIDYYNAMEQGFPEAFAVDEVSSAIIPDKIIDNQNTSITASPCEGYYAGEQKVVLNCDDGEDIFYTVDGSEPNKGSTQYTGEITLNESTQINAITVKDGEISESATLEYVILQDRMDYIYGYGYNSLDRDQQKIYKEMYDCFSKFQTSLMFSDAVPSYEAERIYWCVNYDNPLLFHLPYEYNWLGTTSMVRGMSLSYTYTQDIVEKNSKLAVTQADKILQKANGSKSLMDYLVIVHDEILNNAVYKQSPEDGYRAFGVLVNGEGVCESYSRAFALICRKIGLENLIVVGDYNKEDDGHMWNMIKLGGNWYHIDLTWDDNDDGTISYDYFNLTQKQICSDGRNISPMISALNYDAADCNFYPIPEAKSDTFNYYKYYLLDPPDYNSWGNWFGGANDWLGNNWAA